jgi:hypothetical protein
MSTEKLVNNALFGKTELSTQKVELANLQSVVKLDDTAFKIKDKALASAKKAQDFLIDVSNNSNAAISAFNAVIAEVDTLEKQAADLGLSLPNDARVARDSAKRELSQFTELKSKVSGIKL